MSDSNLEIKPVKRLEINDNKNYHANLPSIKRNDGSLILLIGPTASGKSTLIQNLMYNKNMFGRNDQNPNGAFDGVFVFSPSIYLDDTSRFMIEDFTCSDVFRNDDLENIKQNQLMLPKEERGKIMIIVDDSVGLDVLKNKSALTYYATRNRHLNANIIVSVQNYRACNSVLRNNAKCLIMMNGIYNSKELEKIQDEVGDCFRGTLLYCYKKYANKKFKFLTLYPREVPARMILNFTTEINWKSHVKDSKNFDFENYDSENDNDIDLKDDNI